MGTSAEQRASRTQVARFLYPDWVARVEEHASGEIERLLGACRNYHLTSMAAYRPGCAQVIGDGLAQRPVAGWVARTEQIRRSVPPAPRQERSPNRGWEGI